MNKPTTAYKLFKSDMTTYGGYQWKVGETRTFSGTGELCGPGWAHAYLHPLLAVLLNPIYGNYNLATAIMRRCKAVIGKTNYGLKVGCVKLTPGRLVVIPEVSLTQRIAFGILAAKAICSEPKWSKWADDWLAGKDRTRVTAEDAAHLAARAAADDAAAWAAAADDAAAAWAAAYAAEAFYAATNTTINLVTIAKTAMAEK